MTERLTFHDADWHYHVWGFDAWRCKADGGWCVRVLNVTACKPHRELPGEVTVSFGRLAAWHWSSGWTFARLIFVPRYYAKNSMAAKRHAAERA